MITTMNTHSINSTNHDPFQRRQGKTLVWRSVNMRVKDKGKKQILNNVWGRAANETTAILGPSGSGKTSLLNILAGRVTTSTSLSVESEISLDGVVVDPTSMQIRHQIAFVAQDDALHISSTPRDAILFSAKLRLRKTTTTEELTSMTNTMLLELGLSECADTIIGGALLKGISGGERKRTSVAVELVTKPTLVFLDEPTSGLDSFSALQLTTVLQKVAAAGASVLFTIHQPASDIFESFDRIILLNKGRVMYQGSVEQAPDYFGARGYPLKPRYNPADFFMIVAQTIDIEELERLDFFPADDLPLEAESNKANDDPVSASVHSAALQREKGISRVSMWTEFVWLAKRDLLGIKRNPMTLGARLILSSFMSVLAGLIFWQVAGKETDDPIELQSHFGGVIIALMIAMFSTALPTLIMFPEERPVFIREYSTNHYNVVSYFLSRLGLETFLTAIQILVVSILTYFMIDFQLSFGWHFMILYSLAMTSTALAMVLGSTVEDPKLAAEFLPMILVPQILFSGFFIATELIPVWLRWLQYLTPFNYAVKLYVELEFADCAQTTMTCQNLLDSLNISSDDVWWYWLSLLGLFVVLRASAFIALQRKADKYY